MRLSRFHLATVKEVPADAEVISHKLMLRAGMVRKLAAGIYTWSPLGLLVLRRVERIVREEMDRAGAIEVSMPSIQPRELWEETGRWQKFGGQLLKIRDRKDAEYCYGPTHEEVITDFARQEIRSYKQLPINFYQIQTKFRDEIRPRFGVMRAREFLMKDAYSFHLSQDDLAAEYRNMYDTYARIFTRLGLEFRAVRADSGAIGGDASQEFHVIAESGEDALAYSTDGDYAANVEAAEAMPPAVTDGGGPQGEFKKIATPGKTTCEEVAGFLGLATDRIIKTIAIVDSNGQFALVMLRGDHQINEIKLRKLPAMSDYRLATDAEIQSHLNCRPGYIGPVNVLRGEREPHRDMIQTDPSNIVSTLAPLNFRRIIDRSAASARNFVCGSNEEGYHLQEVNFGRDLLSPSQEEIHDIRNVVAGDPSPDGRGTLGIARGIEVGHVFQLGQKYAEAMDATVLDAGGKAQVMYMGCYGIGVSRIVAAAIEQNHDDAGIIWPDAMAPWQVAVCVINPKNANAEVAAAGEKLYDELRAAGIDAVLDDRGLRPGVMFADIELIGVPHRVVVSERGIAAGTFEYRHRRASDNEALTRDEVFARVGAK